jgi:hypothetical protein
MRRFISFLCASVALLALPTVASAQLVTNTFNGTVVPNAADGFSPATTPDFADPFGFYPNGPFGGGDLIGRSFSLTTTIDIGSIGNSNFFTGASGYQGAYPYGGLYGCCNSLTASLTINGQTLVFDDQTGLLPQFFTINSDGFVNPNEISLQAFYWAQFGGGVQYFGLLVDLTSTTGVFGSDFTTPLPTLQAGTDFTISYAAFYSIGGEVQNLGVDNVNGPVVVGVPELSTWAMTIVGFAGLGFAGYRKGKIPQSAFAAA